MGAVLLRLALLALGMGLIEIGLTDTLADGSAVGWGLVLVGVLPLLAGTAGFMGQLVSGGRDSGGERHD